MTRNVEVEDVIYALHRAGWSIGDIEVEDEDTGLKFWLVTGRNGENLIRARHPNMLASRWIAVEQASACVMFGIPSERVRATDYIASTEVIDGNDHPQQSYCT